MTNATDQRGRRIWSDGLLECAAPAGATDRLVLRYVPPPGIRGRAASAIDALRFVEAARRQQALHETCDVWAAVQDVRVRDGIAVVEVDGAVTTLMALTAARIVPPATALRPFVDRLCRAFIAYRDVHGSLPSSIRAHDVLLPARTRSALADATLLFGGLPRAVGADGAAAGPGAGDATLGAEAEHRLLREVGRLLARLVHGWDETVPVRPPLNDGPEWRRVGRSGGRWRVLLDALLDPEPSADLRTFDDLRAALPREPRSRRPLAAAAIVLVAGGAVAAGVVLNGSRSLDEAEVQELQSTLLYLANAYPAWVDELLEEVQRDGGVPELDDAADASLVESITLLRETVVAPVLDQISDDRNPFDPRVYFEDLPGATSFPYVQELRLALEAGPEPVRALLDHEATGARADVLRPVRRAAQTMDDVGAALNAWIERRDADAVAERLTARGWLAPATALVAPIADVQVDVALPWPTLPVDGTDAGSADGAGAADVDGAGDAAPGRPDAGTPTGRDSSTGGPPRQSTVPDPGAVFARVRAMVAADRVTRRLDAVAARFGAFDGPGAAVGQAWVAAIDAEAARSGSPESAAALVATRLADEAAMAALAADDRTAFAWTLAEAGAGPEVEPVALTPPDDADAAWFAAWRDAMADYRRLPEDPRPDRAALEAALQAAETDVATIREYNEIDLATSLEANVTGARMAVDRLYRRPPIERERAAITDGVVTVTDAVASVRQDVRMQLTAVQVTPAEYLEAQAALDFGHRPLNRLWGDALARGRQPGALDELSDYFDYRREMDSLEAALEAILASVVPIAPLEGAGADDPAPAAFASSSDFDPVAYGVGVAAARRGFIDQAADALRATAGAMRPVDPLDDTYRERRTEIARSWRAWNRVARQGVADHLAIAAAMNDGRTLDDAVPRWSPPVAAPTDGDAATDDGAPPDPGPPSDPDAAPEPLRDIPSVARSTVRTLAATWASDDEPAVAPFAFVRGSVFRVIGRVDQLQRVEVAASAEAVRAAVGADPPPERVVAGWTRLAAVPHPDVPAHLEMVRALDTELDGLLPTLSDARRATVEAARAAAGPGHWSAVARSVAERAARDDATAGADYRALLDAFDAFHADIDALAPMHQWDVRAIHAARALDAVSEPDGTAARARVGQFLRDTAGVVAALAGDAALDPSQLEAIDALRVDFAALAAGDDARVDFSTIGPAGSTTSWTYDDEREGPPVSRGGPPSSLVYAVDVSDPALPVADARALEQGFGDITFRLLPGSAPERPVYLATEEASIALVRIVIREFNVLSEFPQRGIPRDPSSLVGPRTWVYQGGDALPAPSWLRNDPDRPGDAYPDGTAPAPPDQSHPFTQVVDRLAVLIAARLGCRLPTADELRRAIVASTGTDDPQRLADALRSGAWPANVRDRSVAAQAAWTAELDRMSTVYEGRPPTVGAILHDDDVALDVVDRDDGTLWFRSVLDDPAATADPIGDATSRVPSGGPAALPPFRHLVGNVGEWTLDPGAGQSELAPDASVEQVVDLLRASSVAVVGASALTPPRVGPFSPIAVGARRDTSGPSTRRASQGWCDVGFRLAFAPTGRFTAVAVHASSECRRMILGP